MNVVGRILKLLAPFKGRVLLALLSMLIASGCMVVIPMQTKELLGDAIASGSMHITPGKGSLLFGTLLTMALVGYASFLIMFRVTDKLVASLRSRYLARLLDATMEFHRGARTGEVIDRLVTSLSDVEWFTRYGVSTIFMVLVVIAGSGVMMFVLSARLAVLVLVVVPPVSFGLRLLYRKIQKLEQHGREIGSDLIARLHGILIGIDVAKAFNAQRMEQVNFDAQQQHLVDVQRRSGNLIALVEPVLHFVSALAFLFFFLYGGLLLAEKRLAPETLITFLMYLLILLPQARLLSIQLARWQQLGVALDRLDMIFSVPQEKDLPQARPLPSPVRGQIRFDAVQYQYAGREWVMNETAFRIEPGECIGIVGESGAGKTTLFNLLLRFYHPQGGAVRIDGVDIQEVTAVSLREAITYVPQDAILFNGTILENIRYGRQLATDEDVLTACRLAQTDGFIQSLPDGYETVVGDRGLKLSGGQRQRIAIARALLKDAPILLLDEITSALDSQTEKQLQQGIDAAISGRTTIIIAHRLATVIHLPRILVLNSGRIVDDGPHENLLEHSSTYRDLVATQMIGPSSSF